MFKINTDKFGFAREPQPDRVSRDYAAELVRKLIADEKAAREANDNILDGYISQEADIRGTEDARIQALIGDINAVLNSHGGSISGLLEQVQAEVQARESKDDALQALINALQAASAKEIEDRTSKDTELDTRITAEAQAREAKDTELQANIDKEAKMRGENDSSIRAKLEPLSGIINGAGISHFEYSDGLGIVSDIDFIVTPDYNTYVGIASDFVYSSGEDFSFICSDGANTDLQKELDKKEIGTALYKENGSNIYTYNLANNAFRELRITGALITKLTVAFLSGTTFDERFKSIFIFRTGDSPVLATGTNLIKWFGDDCTGNMLTLQPSKTYRIEFYYNGFDMIANVSSYNTSE